MQRAQSQSIESSYEARPNDELGLRGYTPVKKLGHGSQGDVFLAKRDSDGIEVAIKRLNIESVKTWKTYELFHREAEVLSTLQIDGIAKFYEAVDILEDDPPRAYIVQEYIPGTTLGTLIGQGHRFSLGCTFDIIVQLLTLLKQLHNHVPPVIHRDIKPNNIMLKPLENDRYKVYLLDFGAVANPQLQGGGSTVAGTYGFMPPEQLMGKPVPASDVYAVAAVAVNLITGISPADMPVKDFHLIFEPQMQFMPVNVVNLLRQMLEPNTENRLCDYDILIDAFTNFSKGKYDNSQQKTEEIATPLREYNKQLKEVESYAQPGNIELWQRLPDQTPRPIPMLYKDIINTQIDKAKYFKYYVTDKYSEELDFQTQSNIYQQHYRKNKDYYNNEYSIRSHDKNSIGLGSLIIFGLYIFVLVVLSVLSSIPKIIEINKEIQAILLCLIFIFPIVFIFWLRYHLAKKASLKKQLFNPCHEKEEALNHIKEILTDGRKTIATVLNICYDNISDTACEQNVNTKAYSVHQSPQFRIQYTFNPPDDRTEEDLVHEIIINEPPETFLKVGDPLPILYKIYKDKFGVEHVNSIPFPMVLKDMSTLSYLLGHSVTKKKETESE